MDTHALVLDRLGEDVAHAFAGLDGFEGGDGVAPGWVGEQRSSEDACARADPGSKYELKDECEAAITFTLLC